MKAVLIALLLAAPPAAAQGATGTPKPEDTEVWAPEPAVVTPGRNPGEPPSDAVVLFDGKDLAHWESVRGGEAGWTVVDGEMRVVLASGSIQTRATFTDYQLHLEWRAPEGVTGRGQLRGNSGVFLASTGAGDAGYELQVLDSYQNATYANGQAASVYKQAPPLANAMRPPGQWQTYDIVWTAPRFGQDGALVSPARVTAFHNGVLVQNGFELKGPTVFIGKPAYRAHGPSPLKLQAHAGGGPVAFRNIWIRELK